ncbi:hypothetical protein WJX72_004991 [[Myrmecia] bisecta]|uniref:F-box domain-containing protein n=1 Tax=[Myrmecia] bisecta TaxID=41462 RepID=A0AAW1PDT8_9CHLO
METSQALDGNILAAAPGILEVCLGSLSRQDLGRAACVCKAWRSVLSPTNVPFWMRKLRSLASEHNASGHPFSDWHGNTWTCYWNQDTTGALSTEQQYVFDPPLVIWTQGPLSGICHGAGRFAFLQPTSARSLGRMLSHGYEEANVGRTFFACMQALAGYTTALTQVVGGEHTCNPLPVLYIGLSPYGNLIGIVTAARWGEQQLD